MTMLILLMYCMDRHCSIYALVSASSNMAARHLKLGVPLHYLVVFFAVVGFYALTISSEDITEPPELEVSPSEDPYCTFFNNRAPAAQPNLKNCTWYKDHCCCRQVEIEVAFGKVKPLQGATLPCQKYINYLICYICAPTQYKFYLWQRLTVCEEFCDLIFDSCKDAILKGSPIGELYKNGTNFCKSRRFEVAPYSSGKCFYFNETLDTSSAGVMLSPGASWAPWAVVVIVMAMANIDKIHTLGIFLH